MNTEAIIQSLDAQIGGMQRARNILAGKKLPQRETKLKRTMSPEGRKAIAAGQKRRWAERNKDNKAA